MTRGLLGQSHSPPAVILQRIKHALSYDLQTKLLNTLLMVCAFFSFLNKMLRTWKALVQMASLANTKSPDFCFNEAQLVEEKKLTLQST